MDHAQAMAFYYSSSTPQVTWQVEAQGQDSGIMYVEYVDNAWYSYTEYLHYTCHYAQQRHTSSIQYQQFNVTEYQFVSDMNTYVILYTNSPAMRASESQSQSRGLFIMSVIIPQFSVNYSCGR